MLFFLLTIACKEPLPSTSGSTSSGQSSASGTNKGCKLTNYWKDIVAGQKTVSLSGSFQYEGDPKVPISLDLISAQKNQTVVGYECSSSLLHTQPSIDFSVEVPAELGAVWGFAFIDADDEGGKSKTDPHGRSKEFEVTTTAISDITIQLTTEKVVTEGFEQDAPMDAAQTLDPYQKRVPGTGEASPDETK